MGIKPIIIKEDHALVPLTQEKFAIIDLDDIELIGANNWRASKDYAIRVSKNITIHMHRVINKTPEGLETDHINGNKSDNRKANLRSATKAENQHNQHKIRGLSKYKGVHWMKSKSRWKAKIRKHGKHIHIGLFKSEIDAAKAYDKKASEIFGEYAYINF